tara:strand:+ start:669 stop:866 length:198 start_codon:yes stop_codon:yes gene_type:complete
MNIISEKLEKKEMTPRTLAEAIGEKHINNIYRIIAGKQIPRQDKMEKICKLLDLEPNDFYPFMRQ